MEDTTAAAATNNDKRKQAPEEDAAKKKAKVDVQKPEEEVDYESAAMEVAGILSRHKDGRAPEIDRSGRFEVELPGSYGEDCQLVNHRIGEDDRLSRACFYFLHQVGWIATHLMYAPYTEYRVVTEETILHSLNLLMHPKHWTNGWYLHEIIPGWPLPFAPPDTYQGEAMYVGKNLKNRDPEAQEATREEKEERQRLEESGQEDPDGLVRTAADAGVYLCQLLNRASMGMGGYSGEIASNRTGFDEEKDKAREPMYQFCTTMCKIGSRALFEELTSDDKAEIDSILGPGFSDLPALLDIARWTGTGAQDFDKVCPLPPLEYRLDACNMLPYIFKGLMYDRTLWGGVYPVLTPQAAAILTAALSAVLYKTHQHQLETKSKEENSEVENSEEEEGADEEPDGDEGEAEEIEGGQEEPREENLEEEKEEPTEEPATNPGEETNNRNHADAAKGRCNIM